MCAYCTVAEDASKMIFLLRVESNTLVGSYKG